MYKKILAPLDGSELSEAALAHARSLAQCMGAEIMLLRVVDSPLYWADPSADTTYMAALLDGMQAMRQAATTYLEMIALELRKAGLNVTTAVEEGGVAADDILDYAHIAQADLIVMSTHGRSGIQRWLLGSVADKVVHGAKIPVLLIRPCREAQHVQKDTRSAGWL